MIQNQKLEENKSKKQEMEERKAAELQRKQELADKKLQE